MTLIFCQKFFTKNKEKNKEVTDFLIDFYLNMMTKIVYRTFTL